MNIQFHHKRNEIYKEYFPDIGGISAYEIDPRGGATIAIEAIEPWLLDQLFIGDFFTRRVGVAKCSDEDNYNKKIGRDIALSRLKPVVLTVVDKRDFGVNKVLILQDDKNNKYVFNFKDGAKAIHFVDYE